MDIYELLKKPFFARYQVDWRWPVGQEADRSNWQQVSFASQSGAEIKGLYGWAITEKAKASIVCGHPIGTAAKGFYLKQGHANLLRQHGYHVLLFDFNGFGESASGSFTYPLDVIAAGQKMHQLEPSMPIGYLGVSFGAGWGICAFAQAEHHFEVAVLEGPFTSLEEYWQRYPIPYRLIKSMGVFMPKLAHALRPIEQVANMQKVKSVLYIYGELDDTTPPEMAHRFQAASNIPTDLWLVPSTKHTLSLATAPEEYQRRVIGFFDDAFLGNEQREPVTPQELPV
jgi:pimeloyl-ACP methyl ester carboxylesterase